MPELVLDGPADSCSYPACKHPYHDCEDDNDHDCENGDEMKDNGSSWFGFCSLGDNGLDNGELYSEKTVLAIISPGHFLCLRSTSTLGE